MAQQPIFTMLPFSVSNAALPVIPGADIERLYPYEADAYGHWLFGGSSASLTDQVNGRSLTVQSDGVSYPDAAYLSMSGAQGKGILTDIEETATIADTIAIVVRRTVSGPIGMIFGSLSPSTDTPTSGFSPFFSPGDSIWVRANGLNTSSNTGLTDAQDTWHFIATSRDFAVASHPSKVLVGGQAIYERTDASGTFEPAPPPRKIAIGSAYYNASNLTMDVAEFMYFDRAMSAAELTDLYARSKARQAARGVTVV